MTNPFHTHWRGRIPTLPQTPKLVRDFVMLANDQRKTLAEIAIKAKLSPASLRNWRYRQGPSLASFQKALAAIGYELTIRQVRTGIHPQSNKEAQGCEKSLNGSGVPMTQKSHPGSS